CTHSPRRCKARCPLCTWMVQMNEILPSEPLECEVMNLLHDHYSSETTVDSEEYEGDYPEVLMDQISQERFNFPVFWEQLVLHLSVPLSIPAYCAAGEFKLLQNTLLWPWRKPSELFFSCIPLICYVNMALFVTFRDRFAEDGINGAEIVMIPTMAMMVHRAMIALKYSALSHTEYQRWRNAPAKIAHTWGLQIQLLTTWLPLPDDVLLTEIDKACQLQGVDLRSIYFEQEVQGTACLQRWQVWEQMQEPHCTADELHSGLACEKLQTAVMEAANEKVEKGVKRVSAHRILHVLWRQAIDNVMVFRKFSFVGLLAAIPTLLPGIWRVCTSYSAGERGWDLFHAAVGNSAPVMYCVVSSALLCLIHCILAGAFAAIGPIHYQRQQIVIDSVRLLTRQTACLYPNLPQVQLCGATACANVRAVLACFEVVLCMGGRYQIRVESYIATLAGSAFIGMSVVLVSVIVGVHTEMNPFTVTTLFFSVFVTVMVFEMIYFGSKANENFGKLGTNICRARWQNVAEKAEDLEEAEQVMSLAMEKIAILAETEPVTLAGTVLTCDLGYSVVSVVSTLILFVVGKLYNWDIPA
ncbi:unnamed protein product, partial [Effrenium voratum]